MLSNRYDVVIVGSGPAGGATARALRGSDLNAVLIERDRLPRHKMCSGIIFPRARRLVDEEFGPIPKEVLSEPVRVRGNRVYPTLEGPGLPAPFSIFDDDPSLSTEGVSVKREDFDHWLCLESGLPIEDGCEFQGYRRDGDALVLDLSRDGTGVEVRTRFLVGADGCVSSVRGAVSRSFARSVRLIPNYEEWYVGEIDLEPELLHLFFDRRITGYFATVLLKDGCIVAVTGTHGDEPVRECFHRFAAHLEERHGLRIEKRVHQGGCGVHDMSATENYLLGEEGVLLVGEAGGFNRCGEGITPALVTGRAAGECIVRAFESGGSAFSAYSEAVVPEIEACTRVNRAIEAASGLNPFTRD